ncbi:MAG: hypothetical protein HWN79_06455 [Candidatus Lokiarchaeota archaeon]|nr:hypothetical protein [Candidatus Lokiarchaeota archaeon]
MFIINEKTSKLTNFLAPSMVVAVGAILLSFLQNLIITIIASYAIAVILFFLLGTRARFTPSKKIERKVK